MNEMPKKIERKVIYESEYICLYSDKVKLTDGIIIEKYHQLHYPKESVAIVIFNKNDDIMLIHNRRYTLGHPEWEIPAGRIDDNENPIIAARRETMEETGCELKDLKYLFRENPSNGMSDEIVHIFAAVISTEGNIQDTNEIATKKWFKKEEYLDMLRMNKTSDGITIAAILYAITFYKKSENL